MDNSNEERRKDHQHHHQDEGRRRSRHENYHQQREPKVGDIVYGEIVRIEKYGAFCSFRVDSLSSSSSNNNDMLWKGLIHISQLYENRIENVEDVVSLHDKVWVKIIEIEPDNNLRIKLSMKDVSQDGSCQDLGRQRDQMEQAKAQLETNLNSMIGMGVARDPMDQHLIYKNASRSGKMSSSNTRTFRGGYTLVGDDEGEPEITVSVHADAINTTSSTLANEDRHQIPPLGRGRGATLPAWMTVKDKLTGIGNEEEGGAQEDKEKKRKKKKKREKHDRSSRKSKKKRKKRCQHSDYSNTSSGSSSSYENVEHTKKRIQVEERSGDGRRNRHRHEKRRRSVDSSRRSSYSDASSVDSIPYSRRRRGDSHKKKKRRRKSFDDSESR